MTSAQIGRRLRKRFHWETYVRAGGSRKKGFPAAIRAPLFAGDEHPEERTLLLGRLNANQAQLEHLLNLFFCFRGAGSFDPVNRIDDLVELHGGEGRK